MKRILSRLFLRWPEGTLKNRVRCRIYNAQQQRFRVAWDERSGIWTITDGEATMLFRHNPFSLFITDQDYTECTTVKEGDFVIDAGAFIGSFTIWAAKTVGPSGSVIALEPDASTRERLLENLALNDLPNVKVLPLGLWSREGVLSFESGRELGSSFVTTARQGSVGVAHSVGVTTLDELLKNVPAEQRVFIKMNIEGAEAEALNGASVTLHRSNTHWVVRADHLVDGVYTDAAVSSAFVSSGLLPKSVRGFTGRPSITVHASSPS